MSDGFTIGAASYGPTIFPCPKCHETIYSTAETCRFCGHPVDHEAARKAAELLAKINQACSDASYLKSTALTVPVFLLLRFVPFISNVGAIGFVGLLFVIPLWALRWWIKYRRIVTTDGDFLKARRTVTIAGMVVAILLALLVVFEVITILISTRN